MKGHLHLPHPHNQRLQRIQAPTYERLQARLAEDHSEPTEKPLSIHCGWGRLLIGQTYPDAEELARDLLQEAPGERDIALYVAAPQQVLAHAPQQLFLDPSDTLRLWFTDYRPARRPPRGFRIRRVHTEEDWAAINRLYLARGMLPVQTERLSPRHQGGPIYWLAEDADTGVAVGTVMGLNHAKAFQDPEGGSSLWCLAVDPQCSRPGVGEALVRHLVEHFMSRELAYLDLGAAQQPAGQGALPQARLPRTGDLHHQAQERHQPVAVPRPRPGGRPQPLRPDHRRRSPPARHRGARRRRRGRPVHPDPGRPADPLP